MRTAFICALLTTVSVARAAIPEPDNLIYGNITLDNALVTATRTDVVIEARRTTNGLAISSYRMGSNPNLGNFYSLRLTIESGAPVADSNALLVTESVYIVVTDGSGLRAEAPFTIAERGAAQRIDFGVAAVDGDGDGLPDAWELQRYSNLDQLPDSVAPNGLTALQNFIAGTDPLAPDGGFRLHITSTNNQKQVSFVALKAQGPGYEGMTRLYTLESNSVFTAGLWGGVTDYMDIAGNDQTVNYVASGVGTAGYFRGKVTLLGFDLPNGDADNDSLPDAWETFHFGNLSQTAASFSANGQTALQNYVAGTDPNSPTSHFGITLTLNNDQLRVSFMALRADGAGYEGQNRYYSLETSSDPTATTWQGVTNFTNLLGNDQPVNYLPPTIGAAYFRARVWLQTP